MTDFDPREEIIEHLPAMRAFAMSLTRDPTLADDIVQDTIVKAWTNFDSYKPGTKLRAWLFTILRNALYSHHRKYSREIEDVDGAHAARLAVQPNHDTKLMLNDVIRAFDRLSVEQREAIWLVAASGFSYEEAAEMCGVSLGTIKSRMNRGRSALSAHFGFDAEAYHDMIDAQATLTTPEVSDANDAA